MTAPVEPKREGVVEPKGEGEAWAPKREGVLLLAAAPNRPPPADGVDAAPNRPPPGVAEPNAGVEAAAPKAGVLLPKREGVEAAAPNAGVDAAPNADVAAPKAGAAEPKREGVDAAVAPNGLAAAPPAAWPNTGVAVGCAPKGEGAAAWPNKPPPAVPAGGVGPPLSPFW